MWMMGYTGDDDEFNTINQDHSFPKGHKLIMRPLIARPAAANPPPCLTHIHMQTTDLLTLNHHMSMVEQNRFPRDDHPLSGGQQVVVSSRWNPTPEQLQTLEELYRRGTRTPSADQIQHITAELRRYGKIEGKNVFYWFQNHKARERQKRRRQLKANSSDYNNITSSQSHGRERKESSPAGRVNRTVLEVEETKNWAFPTNSSTVAEGIEEAGSSSEIKAFCLLGNEKNRKAADPPFCRGCYCYETLLGFLGFVLIHFIWKADNLHLKDKFTPSRLLHQYTISIQNQRTTVSPKAAAKAEAAAAAAGPDAERKPADHGWLQFDFDDQSQQQSSQIMIRRNDTWTRTMHLPCSSSSSSPTNLTIINYSSTVNGTSMGRLMPAANQLIKARDFVGMNIFVGTADNSTSDVENFNYLSAVHGGDRDGGTAAGGGEARTLQLFPINDCRQLNDDHEEREETGAAVDSACSNADHVTPHQFFEFLPLKN